MADFKWWCWPVATPAIERGAVYYLYGLLHRIRRYNPFRSLVGSSTRHSFHSLIYPLASYVFQGLDGYVPMRPSSHASTPIKIVCINRRIRTFEGFRDNPKHPCTDARFSHSRILTQTLMKLVGWPGFYRRRRREGRCFGQTKLQPFRIKRT